MAAKSQSKLSKTSKSGTSKEILASKSDLKGGKKKVTMEVFIFFWPSVHDAQDFSYVNNVNKHRLNHNLARAPGPLILLFQLNTRRNLIRDTNIIRDIRRCKSFLQVISIQSYLELYISRRDFFFFFYSTCQIVRVTSEFHLSRCVLNAQNLNK